MSCSNQVCNTSEFRVNVKCDSGCSQENQLVHLLYDEQRCHVLEPEEECTVHARGIYGANSVHILLFMILILTIVLIFLAVKLSKMTKQIKSLKAKLNQNNEADTTQFSNVVQNESVNLQIDQKDVTALRGNVN